MRTAEIDPSEVLEWMARHFSIDTLNGKMIWTTPPKNHPRMKGQPAGSLRLNASKKPYCYVKMNKHSLRRSWLIFLWVYKTWPKECIDHIDGNSLNDSIGNLREATITENAWNHKKRARRIKLPMGVRIIKSGRYQARIAHNKRMLHLGAFDTPGEAHSTYLAKRKELYREFA